MFGFPKTVRNAAVAISAGTGLTVIWPVASLAGGPGIWATSRPVVSGPVPVCYECTDTEPPGLLDRCDERAGQLWDRVRKAPFDHYAHNPGDLKDRPICPPYCSPTAGYHEPRWRQLPDARGGFATAMPHMPVGSPIYSDTYYGYGDTYVSPPPPQSLESSPMPPASPSSPPPAPPSAPAEQPAPRDSQPAPQEFPPLENDFPDFSDPPASPAAPPAAFLPPYPPGAGPSLTPLAGQTTPTRRMR